MYTRSEHQCVYNSRIKSTYICLRSRCCTFIQYWVKLVVRSTSEQFVDNQNKKICIITKYFPARKYICEKKNLKSI